MVIHICSHPFSSIFSDVFVFGEITMSSIKGLAAACGGVGVVLIFLFCILFALGALLWPYTINTWLIYSGRPPQIEWWMGGLMGLVPGIGQSCIPAAFITFILMLFIGSAVV